MAKVQVLSDDQHEGSGEVDPYLSRARFDAQDIFRSTGKLVDIEELATKYKEDHEKRVKILEQANELRTRERILEEAEKRWESGFGRREQGRVMMHGFIIGSKCMALGIMMGLGTLFLEDAQKPFFCDPARGGIAILYATLAQKDIQAFV